MRRAGMIALTLLAALAAPPLRATTALERSTNDMIQEAQVILTGRCTHVESRWVGRDLVTLATIAVSEPLKGQAGSEVTVVIPGGVDSKRAIPIAMTFPAAPTIQLKEDVLLFLTPENQVAGGFAIVGFSQGKFTVAQDPKGKSLASQNLAGLRLMSPKGAVSPGMAKTISIPELRQQIRNLAGANER
jgi:hypothetical protein